MGEVTFLRTEQDKHGNTQKVHMLIGGKEGYFSRDQRGDIKWFCMELGEPNDFLIKRGRRMAREEFSPPPRRSFPRAGAVTLHKQTLFVSIKLVLPDSDSELEWMYRMPLWSGKTRPERFFQHVDLVFTGEEKKKMWKEANRVLQKRHDEILRERKQLDLFANE